MLYAVHRVGANFSSLALEYMGKIAGTANAVYGFVTMTVSSFLGFMVVILITEKGRLFNVGEGKG